MLFLYVRYAEGQSSCTRHDGFHLILLFLFSSFKLGMVRNTLPDVTGVVLVQMPASF